MKLLEQCRDRKIHARKIEISSFAYDEEHILVVGTLKDDILIPVGCGEKMARG